MVDKVWYDWQKRRLSNFWAFHGGTIQAFQNSTAFAQYPNGEPPFMNVSTTDMYASFIRGIEALLCSLTQPCQRMACTLKRLYII